MTPSNSDMYLDPEQQNLLMAALASNNNNVYPDPRTMQHQYAQNLSAINNFTALDKNEIQPRHAGPASNYSNSEMDMTRPNSVLDFSTHMHDFNGISPVIDNLEYPYDVDSSYDYDLGLNGDYPTVDSSSITSPTFTEHEKRKTPPTDDGEDGSPSAEVDPKRREKDGEDKVAKKPGRKPLTSEPTSKRKAQNRAAQRAFRERKEKHLKDLEEKVADLEKASESANRENSALRQQIDRLQSELKDYRKKMAEKSNSSSIIGKGSNGGFQFEFPRFGMSKPPASDNGRSQKDGHINGIDERYGPGSNAGRVRSSNTPSSGSATVRPSTHQFSTQFNNTPQPAPDHSTVMHSSYYTPKTRSGSTFSDDTGDSSQNTPMSKLESSTSPSASSVSHHGATPATSPESNSNSPTIYNKDHLEPVTEEIIPVMPSEHDEPGFYCGMLDDGETTFCEKLGAIACGNPRNPVPVDLDSNTLPNLNEVIPKPDASARNSYNISTMAAQNGGAFDPVLFNDYRDPMTQSNIDLNMSFFDDAFPISGFSLGSPLPESPEIEKKEMEMKKNAPAGLQEVDEAESDDDEAFLPQAKPDHNLMSCNKIWDRISAHPSFVSGEMDMDKLCSELRSKAKCSETGVVVEQKDVEKVLSMKDIKKDANGNPVTPKSQTA